MRHHQPTAGPAALVLAAGLLVAAAVPPATAQTREASIGYTVRVTAREVSVFAQSDPRSPLVARVRSGDLLVVVGKENAWYKVRIPRDRKVNPNGPDSGYVEVKSVAVTGPGGATGVGGGPVAPGQAPAPAAAAAARAGAQGWGAIRLRPFGEFAFQTFTASQSFKAIFGSSTGFFYGGGVDMALSRSLGLGVAITHFQKTGERAFAYNGESFPLGVAERVSMTPITFNVTYRFAQKGFTPYVGGGAGAVVYRETSDFANADENVSKTGTAFQVLGGVEFPLGQHLSAAVEGQYQGVTGILGDTGVSQVFNETDLGGFSIRARLIFGK